MSFFRKIFFSGQPALPKASNSTDPYAWWIYVRCGKCGAPLAIRIDLRNDISTDYETGGRFLRKEIMDSTCFQLMYAEVRFDGNGKVIEQTIERGKVLTKAEYDQARAEFQAKHDAP